MSKASRIQRLVVTSAVAALVFAAGAGSARGQGAGVDEAEVSIDTVVAKALVDRGMKLFRARDYLHARQMFIEALERDPNGPHAGSALTMLRRSNTKLGRYKDEGVPELPKGGGGGGGGDTVIDPYGGGGDGDGGGDGGGDTVIDPYGGGGGDGGGDTVIDPYAGGGGGDDTVIDPYAGGGGGGGGPPDTGEPEPGTASSTRRELMVWSGGYGFTGGLAIAGDSDSAALIGLLGGAAGVGVAWWASNRLDLSQGEVSAVETLGTWGAVNAGFIGHLIDGTDSEYTAEEYFRYSAVGGLLGVAAGTLWARKSEPDASHIAFANSMAAYASAGGLFLGLVMAPPEDEAYTLNAAIGSTIGFAGGMYFAPKLELSRKRTLKMDLGAALGAGAPWALLYPLIDDDTTNNDEQVVGALSMLTLGGGAYLAWRLTRGEGDAEQAEQPAPPPVAAFARRNAAGQWSFGVPLPRPMENPALAPPSGAFTFGADLLGGRF